MQNTCWDFIEIIWNYLDFSSSKAKIQKCLFSVFMWRVILVSLCIIVKQGFTHTFIWHSNPEYPGAGEQYYLYAHDAKVLLLNVLT